MLLKKVATTQTDYNELCKLTQVKADESLHPYEGIMVTGFVRIVKPENGLYGAVIGPPDSQRRITVISDRPFDFEAGDRVVLLGSVIPDPSNKIVGYSSSKPWVVWYAEPHGSALPPFLSRHYPGRFRVCSFPAYPCLRYR